MGLAADVTSTSLSSFRPSRADWTNPKDLGRCAQWLFSQRNLKEPLERRTARNIAFLEGRQNYEWSWETKEMRLPREKRGRLQLIYNFCKFLVEQRIAKLARLEPVWSVPAYTSDEFDQVVARFSNDVLNWYWNEGLNMADVNRKVLMWMMTSPIVFLHGGWNPVKGESIEVTFEEFARPIDPATDPAQAAIWQQEDLAEFTSLTGYNKPTNTVITHTGDLHVEPVDIFRAMWYPFWEPNWDNVHIFLKSDVMPVEDVMARYGLTAAQVEKYSQSSPAVTAYKRMLQGWSSPFLPQPRPKTEWEEGVLVHQLYVDSALAKGKGASAVVLGDSEEAVLWGSLGNRYHEMPFRPIVEHPTPGQLWGTCTMDDLIAPQLEINLAKTQQAEWRNTMVRPKIVRVKTDGADDESFKAENQDTIIEVDSLDKKPQVLYMPTSGIEHENAVAWASQFMHQSSAVPSVALGDPAGARSGIMVRSLQEEANERNRTPGDILNDAMSWLGSLLLGELQEKAIARRVAPIVGENNSVEYLVWSRAKLRPTVYDDLTSNVAIVRVSAYTNIPTTPIETRNTVVQLAQLGFLRPGVHDTVIGNAFGMNDLKTTLDTGRADRGRQEREINTWRNGGNVLEPTITDDHAVHQKVLGDWMKSEEFRTITAQFPHVLFEAKDHYDSHAQAKHDEMAREQSRQVFAQMRAGAEFAEKALKAGRPDWAQVFVLQSTGGAGNLMTQLTSGVGGHGGQDPTGTVIDGDNDGRVMEKGTNAVAQQMGMATPPSSSPVSQTGGPDAGAVPATSEPSMVASMAAPGYARESGYTGML